MISTAIETRTVLFISMTTHRYVHATPWSMRQETISYTAVCMQPDNNIICYNMSIQSYVSWSNDWSPKRIHFRSMENTVQMHVVCSNVHLQAYLDFMMRSKQMSDGYPITLMTAITTELLMTLPNATGIKKIQDEWPIKLKYVYLSLYTW